MKYIKIILLSIILFGLPMGFVFGVFYKNFRIGLLSALASGLLFGLIMTSFIYFQSAKFKKLGTEMPGLIYGDGANHLIKNESVGGYLFLFEDHILFKSHSLNMQSHDLSIPIKDIVTMKRFNNLGIVPNGLSISTLENDERFVVFNVKKWIDKISKIKSESSI